MKCSCDVEPTIVKGQPVKDGGKTYWKQIFVCNNENCPNYKREIGERKINIFNEEEIIEKQY